MIDLRFPVRVVVSEDLRAMSDLIGARRAVLLTSPGMASRAPVAELRTILGQRLRAVVAEVQPNPTIAACQGLASSIALSEGEVLVALGGGSTLDAAKAVVAQQGAAAGWLRRHLREGAKVSEGFAPPPIVAVPTTAGTGSEVTMWATIWDERDGAKTSLSHPSLYPEAAVLVPALTASAPRALTVATGLDALSHAIEASYNVYGNPVSDALGAAAIASLPAALERVVVAPNDLGARAVVQNGALLAGMAFSQTRTALAHSMSYPMTSELGLPHGLACSFTLPEVLVLNAEGDAAAAFKVTGIAAALGCANAAEARERLYALFAALGVGALVRARVPSVEAIEALKGRMINASRAGNNPVVVDEDGARALVIRAWRRLAG